MRTGSCLEKDVLVECSPEILQLVFNRTVAAPAQRSLLGSFLSASLDGASWWCRCTVHGCLRAQGSLYLTPANNAGILCMGLCNRSGHGRGTKLQSYSICVAHLEALVNVVSAWWTQLAMAMQPQCCMCLLHSAFPELFTLSWLLKLYLEMESFVNVSCILSE